MTLDPELLAREGHGAVEVDLPQVSPLKVMLAGPIKYWWSEGQWETPEHLEFIEWRDAVRVACVKAGFLVYSPHRAWQGAWHEDAQQVNDAAIEMADVVLDLTPPGIPNDGTLAERAYALMVGTTVIDAPPSDGEALQQLVDRLNIRVGVKSGG